MTSRQATMPPANVTNSAYDEASQLDVAEPTEPTQSEEIWKSAYWPSPAIFSFTLFCQIYRTERSGTEASKFGENLKASVGLNVCSTLSHVRTLFTNISDPKKCRCLCTAHPGHPWPIQCGLLEELAENAEAGKALSNT